MQDILKTFIIISCGIVIFSNKIQHYLLLDFFCNKFGVSLFRISFATLFMQQPPGIVA